MQSSIRIGTIAPLAWVFLALSGACGGSGDQASASSGSGGAGGVATVGSSGSSGTGGMGGGAVSGPLTVSSNPHYFQDASGHALLLVGSHTWNNLQDWGADATLQTLDFDAYVAFLVKHGHNFTLLWRTELPKFCGLPSTASNPPDITASPQPWPRTGSGTASDGGSKFDLSQFDMAYFDRLHARVSKLNDAGIYAGVYLFTGEWLSAFRCNGDGYPFTGSNNINGIDDGGGNGSMSMMAPNAITKIQDAMVEKTIDVLNDL